MSGKKQKRKRSRFFRITRIRAYLLLKTIKKRLKEQERKGHATL